VKFISLFTGIGGFDLGFERAGMTCVAQVEKDRFARQVLDQHYPTIKKFEDVNHVGKHNLPPADLICGGFPCQDVSIAGRRAGLAGERSGLWHEFERVLSEARPRWVVIENVPGLLSSNGGRDFAVVLRGLVKLGYGVCWRVLDSQYFNVPQRRERLFIVGHLGDGRAAQVLFERQSSSGDTPPRRDAGQSTAATLSAGAPSRRNGGSRPAAGHFVTTAYDGKSITSPRNRSNPRPGIHHTLHAGAHESILTQTYRAKRSDSFIRTDISHTLAARDAKGGSETYAVHVKPVDVRNLHYHNGQISATLQAKNQGGYSLNYQNPVHIAHHVRRLTPVECERLQAFPDGWTACCSDTQRYKQLGNAVTVNVADWIGNRIMMIERSQKET